MRISIHAGPCLYVYRSEDSRGGSSRLRRKLSVPGSVATAAFAARRDRDHPSCIRVGQRARSARLGGRLARPGGIERRSPPHGQSEAISATVRPFFYSTGPALTLWVSNLLQQFG